MAGLGAADELEAAEPAVPLAAELPQAPSDGDDLDLLLAKLKGPEAPVAAGAAAAAGALAGAAAAKAAQKAEDLGIDQAKAEEIFERVAREMIEKALSDMLPKIIAERVDREIEAIKQASGISGNNVVQ